ncbi:NADH:flavin oxidoreductase/NADH oxidase [Ochrobactrum sp. WV_118_8]|uniref:NADH:flavin oxidoreductase/NADH oxidase n=1 Tax=Brucella tritici TaxID=94626 RepID=A0A7V7VQ60_9HYPH|nr:MULTISPECIES: NADH:flavin oxidoreductase/NADH oxidase [Brucella/Ochrobactrum group]KAB2654515.1 NADH:flavin oxidoreductase/NADH oxidase [Brucella tritici]KAB2754878.1 NADH:flavin oxidoreductase/NADH oxidase [Brucella anthropi]KAB2772465.1 NADH:flavin oxidoreductase/NADH oxidase [Brucella anthropi]MCQ9148453.1 NADH:flavin oxidoreductase/NADH oxidase [Ochrobactrum sp. BTU2]MCR8494179.1 NADH:flavin oxidoreductase/NADH oxidase [Brucella anthropi]
MSMLFTSISTGSLSMPNRVVIAPMCQYSAEEGRMTSWHMIHLGQLALSGAGLLTIEATAVSPEGRITYGDVGLWDDVTEAAMVPVLEAIRQWSDIPVAIQLAHAGRKASTEKPWLGSGQIRPDQPNGWQTVAPSRLPFAPDDHAPEALDKAGMERIRDAFVEAARRSVRLGIDAIQLHAAHGYLLHQFLSPLSNHREDAYGGSLENRLRFPLEVFEAVKAAVPNDYPVSVRVSGTDWVDGGWDIDQTVTFAQALQVRGCAAIHVSSGGLDTRQKISLAPGYQVPLARAVKSAVDIPVVAVGMITDFEHAESIVATGDADMIALARGVLYDPRWPWHAAAHLGAQIGAAPQYLRCEPRTHRQLFQPR